MIKLVTGLFALLILASPAWAHGTEKVLNQDSGNYILSLSYDPFELDLGEAVPLGFNISPKVGTGQVDFTHVYVKVVPPKFEESIFAAAVKKAEFGETSVLVKFPGGGDYKISASFRQANDTVAETDFALNVPQPKKLETTSSNSLITKESILFGLGGLVLGYGLSLILKKK